MDRSVRSVRLLQIQALLYHSPRGFTSSALALECHVNQRTINRDMQALQAEPFRLPVVLDQECRWRLAEGHRYTLPPIQFSLQEASALYLAARLLDRVSDEPNPFVARALGVLAGALPVEVGQRIVRMAAARLQEGSSLYARVFEIITLGWATRRKVWMRHQSAGSAHIHDYTLCPYQIEPSGVGFAAYVIGFASYFDQVRTFKIERILEARLLDETFDVPEDFDGHLLLAGAWGVMYGDQSEDVVLRFASSATRRIKETTWHVSQSLEDCADGGCVLRVSVSHPEEMRYWVLGWGGQVEVLAPASLREAVIAEVRRMGEVYGLRGGERNGE